MRRDPLVDGDHPETWENMSIATATLAGSLHRISDKGRADLFPTWSPDGRWIALTGAPDAPGASGNDAVKQAMVQRKIWTMEPDGTAKRQLTNDAKFRDERPEWSANGEYILFARLDEAQAQLCLMRADGSEQKRVVEELTPSPGVTGYFGYIDWGQLYDWWKGPPNATSSAAPMPTPTVPAMLSPRSVLP